MPTFPTATTLTGGAVTDALVLPCSLAGARDEVSRLNLFSPLIVSANGLQAPNSVVVISTLKADGVTAYPIVKVNNANALQFDTGHNASFVSFGQGNTHNLPNLLVNAGAGLYFETAAFDQDGPMITTDLSNNLLIGNANSAGASEMNDTFFQAQTGKSQHWSFNATDRMVLSETKLDVFGGSGGNGMTVTFASGNVAAQGAVIAAGGQVYLNFAGDGIRLDASGAVIGPQVATSPGGWLQNTAGALRVVSNVTNSTTTFATATGLSTTLIAGRAYTGRLVLICSESVAAEGIKIDFNGGGATITSFFAAGSVTNGGANTPGTTQSTTLAGVLNWSTITGTTVIECPISLVCNAGGTFTVRFAQNSHATGTTTLSLGSYLLLEDTP